LFGRYTLSLGQLEARDEAQERAEQYQAIKARLDESLRISSRNSLQLFAAAIRGSALQGASHSSLKTAQEGRAISGR